MDSNKQMEFLFEEGGIADDGMERDPVSGNEVPPGSLAEEVRDDIPAQLSEGEYVVPADVVRFYGVRFFEKLRSEAKEGLGDMQRDGRIGGEPVMMEEEDYEDDDMELSPEEQAELNDIMGMAQGGAVRGYVDGGMVNGTQVYTGNFPMLGAGFSFMYPQGAGPANPIPTIETVRNVTLYGPDGTPTYLSLPADQTEYDRLIGLGYTTTAPQQQTQPQVTTPQQESDPTPSDSDYQRTFNQYTTGSADFSREELDRVRSDPFQYAVDQLDEDRIDRTARMGAVGLLMPGPLGLIAGGAAAGGALSEIAKARAARNIAFESGNYTNEQIAELDAKINAALENAPRSVQMLEAMGFGSGKRFEQDLRTGLAPDNFERPSWMGGQASTARASANAKLSELQGAARAYADDQMRSGYTGSSVNDIAVGKIAGDGQVEGVVAQADGTVLRTEGDKKTVYMDEQGRTYVRTGFFGGGREYRDIDLPEDASVNNTNPNAPSTPQESDSDSEDKGTVICTALHNLGLLEDDIYALDNQYGAMLEYEQPEVLYGYRKMATPLANYIQQNTLGANIARKLVAPVAKAWANEMAHVMQPEAYKGNLLGKAIIKLGYPVCAYVGRNTKETIHGT